MNIGFDAKRAYHNKTGLGNYSRNLLRLLTGQYPEHEYFLFNPKHSASFDLTGKNIHQVLPTNPVHKLFSAAWRSSWVKSDLKKNKIDLYHGLSHEIPVGIGNTGIRSVVTIHDLIPERYPEQYNPVDVKIYHKKFRYACRHADKVIAISEQTKNDILEFYGVPDEKVVVCYQACDPVFMKQVSEEEKKRIKAKYGLPPEFFLYVGSIIARKNLLNICKAMFLLRNELNIPLVVIGEGGKYRKLVNDYIVQNGLQQQIIFLSEREEIKKDTGFNTPATLAAIYQSAVAMIYPSFYEGFGLPVAEALCSRLPVITSNVSCLPEAGGDAAFFADPSRAEEIADGMRKIYTDHELVALMKEKGWRYANRNTPEIYAANVINIYKEVMSS